MSFRNLIVSFWLASLCSCGVLSARVGAPRELQPIEELTPELLASFVTSLNLDPKLNGIFRPIFRANDNGNSPYSRGEPGLFPPELVQLILLTALTGASPSDFDLVNQVCPRFEDDRKYGLDILITGQIGYQDFFVSQSILTGEPYVSAQAPGLCTTSFISHAEIKKYIAALPQLQVDDDVYRGNELGLFRLNDRTFEFCLELLPEEEWESCKIATGLTNADHELVRPFMDIFWGDLNPPGSIFSTEGNTWTKQEFLDSATAFLAGKEVLNLPGDATFWTIKELHKRTLGIDLPDASVQAFVGLRDLSVLLAILPESVVDEFGTSVVAVNVGKKLFVQTVYMPILANRFPELAANNVDLVKVAMGVLDGFIFAGGASVPSTIKNGLAAYYQGLIPKGRFSPTNPRDLGVLVLETVRSYPPVLGFPYIDQISGQRFAPLPGMAGYDKSVYGGDADKFGIRGDLSYYHERSLNWADSALPVEGKPFSNHICPGRSMSYSMIVAFWEALDASQWCVDPETPIAKETGSTFWSDFTLLKGSCSKKK